jgi:hypothetical protein
MRTLMSRTALLWIALLPYTAVGRTPGPVSDARGAEVYRALAVSGALDPYMKDLIEEVLGHLVGAAYEWPGYQVNGPFRHGWVNVYSIDAERLPEPRLEISGVKDINLRKENLRGSGFTDEESGTIFIDSGMLKQYLASVMNKLETGAPLVRAVAEVQAQGRDSLGYLWDPAINPSLNARLPAAAWLNLYRGMIAFVLAHEMGHIHTGKQPASADEEKVTVRNAHEKDLQWACSDMLSPKTRAMQQIEMEADQYAAGLISQVLFPEGALRVPLLWYELGAQMYLVYSLSVDAINAVKDTQSNYFRKAMEIQLGAKLYAQLISQITGPQGGFRVLYPARHPATVERVHLFLQTVAESPYSCHHAQPSNSPELLAMRMVLGPACAELKRKYEIR